MAKPVTCALCGKDLYSPVTSGEISILRNVYGKAFFTRFKACNACCKSLEEKLKDQRRA